MNNLPDKKISFEVGNQTVQLSPSMVRNYLTKGNGQVTDQEVVMFINLCKFQRLNPFLNEAYLIKYGKSSPASIVTSKEAFMKRADSNPHYKGLKAGCVVARQKQLVKTDGAILLPGDQLLGGWATVKRDDREDTHVEVSMQEFGKNQSTWKSMPANMIRKTAIVNALREAFPETLEALYTEDDKVEPQPSAPHDITNQATEEGDKKKSDDLMKEALGGDDNANSGQEQDQQQEPEQQQEQDYSAIDAQLQVDEG